VKRRAARAIIVVLVIAIVAGGATIWSARQRARVPAVAETPAPRIPQPEIVAPAGARVRVQVLNGTKTRGLARRATMVLRDHGFDVVETGTDVTARDTTIVYDLNGHPDWAAAVAKLFVPARVIARRDTSRYLDVTVSIGSTWRAPAQPFYP
jgi:hypothetical protein